MSGRRSTRSWLYENRPSTQSAAMTMVAKTGLLMDTRVNHMGSQIGQDFGVAEAGFDAVGAARCATTLAGLPSFRLSKRDAST